MNQIRWRWFSLSRSADAKMIRCPRRGKAAREDVGRVARSKPRRPGLGARLFAPAMPDSAPNPGRREHALPRRGHRTTVTASPPAMTRNVFRDAPMRESQSVRRLMSPESRDLLFHLIDQPLE